MIDSQTAILHKARNAVQRLKLHCQVDGVEQALQKQLFHVKGQGMIEDIVLLAKELQADIVAPVFEHTFKLEKPIEFVLLIMGDDTVFDDRKYRSPS